MNVDKWLNSGTTNNDGLRCLFDLLLIKNSSDVVDETAGVLVQTFTGVLVNMK